MVQGVLLLVLIHYTEKIVRTFASVPKWSTVISCPGASRVSINERINIGR